MPTKEDRRFVAFLISTVAWKAILVTTLVLTADLLVTRTDIEGAGGWMWWFLWTIVLVTGFIEAGYIGGQTWLDSYTALARITARPGRRPKPTQPAATTSGEE